MEVKNDPPSPRVHQTPILSPVKDDFQRTPVVSQSDTDGEDSEKDYKRLSLQNKQLKRRHTDLEREVADLKLVGPTRCWASRSSSR